MTPTTAWLRTQGEGAEASTYASLGIQADLHLVLFSMLNMTFSVGYGRAWRLATDSSGVIEFNPELLISLKIL